VCAGEIQRPAYGLGGWSEYVGTACEGRQLHHMRVCIAIYPHIYVRISYEATSYEAISYQAT